MRRSFWSLRLKSRHVAPCLTSAAVLALAAGLAPRAAHAACGSSTANGGGGLDYVISGAELTTCNLGANDTLNITSSGSIVTNSGHALTNAAGATSILNDGLLSASDAVARSFGNSANLDSFVNTGTISASVGAMAVVNTSTITLFDNDNGEITSSNLITILNSGTMTLTNSLGVIENTGGWYAIESSNGTLNLDNTNGQITSVNREAVVMAGGSINNTGGLISTQNESAIDLNAPLTGPLVNTEGTIQSGATDETEGTINIENDIGTLTIVGGTIVNTNTTEDDVSAVSIDADLPGMLTFDGVDIIADGTGVGQGYAIYIYERDVNLTLTASTNVRGTIFQYSSSSFFNLTTSATILGNITGAQGNDTVTVNGGSITGTVFLEEGDDTVTLNGGTITGLVDLEDDNDTFTLGGGTMKGNVVLEDGNDTFTYTAGTMNGDVNFGKGENTFNVNGVFATAGRQFITDPTAGTNLIVGATGDFAIDDPISLWNGSVTTVDGGRLYVRSSFLNANQTFTNDGTTQIGVDGDFGVRLYNPAGIGNLIFDVAGVAGAMDAGAVTFAQSPVNLANQTVSVNFTGGLLNEGAKAQIMSGAGAGTLPGGAVTDNSILYDFGIELGQNPEEVFLTLLTVKEVEQVSTTQNNKNVGTVLLEDLAETDNPEISQIQANLGNASTQQEFNEILESTTPPVDQGNQVAAVGMTGAMFDLADGQLAMVNTGETGAGAGNTLTGLHFWGQGFGGWADQGFRKGFDGYDADVHGLAMGVDTRNFDRDTVVGLSIGAARTDVQSRNANRTQTDVEGYQLMLYGNHELGDHVFVTGMALYGWNGNEQSRFNVGGVPGLTADAEYDSWVGGLRSSIGRNYILSPGAMHADAFQITPQLFSEFVRFSRDGYDETGAGGANLSVGDARQTIWNFGISVQAEWTYIVEGGGKLKPDVHVSYKYDVMDDRADTTASFFAGGSSFESQGVDPANSVFGIGVGVKFYDTSGWDFTANYDFTFKDAYEAHSAFVRAAYEF